MIRRLGIILCIILMTAVVSGCSTDNQDQNNQNQIDTGEQVENEYFMSQEAYYRGVGTGTTEEELVEILGNPVSVIDTPEDITTKMYVYEDAIYSFTPYGLNDNSENRLYLISVTGGQYETIRGLKVGATLEDVFSKFPQEQDYSNNDDGLFFGKRTIDGQGGAVIDGEIVLTSENLVPFVKMEVDQDVITAVNYYMLRVH